VNAFVGFAKERLGATLPGERQGESRV